MGKLKSGASRFTRPGRRGVRRPSLVEKSLQKRQSQKRDRGDKTENVAKTRSCRAPSREAGVKGVAAARGMG